MERGQREGGWGKGYLELEEGNRVGMGVGEKGRGNGCMGERGG